MEKIDWKSKTVSKRKPKRRLLSEKAKTSEMEFANFIMIISEN